LRPITPAEAKLFERLLRGDFLVQGFRNRDVRSLLTSETIDDRESLLRASGRATRWLRLFRAHGLIAKVGQTRYYRVNNAGQKLMTVVLKVRRLDLVDLAA